MANYRIPGPLDASRGNHDVRDGTGQRRAGVTPGFINGAAAGNTSAWDAFLKNAERVEAVYDAVGIGQQRAGAAILRETGHALEELVKGLIPGLLMMMVVLVATTVIGGVIGAVIGFFAGGAGAAPGAVIGADLGVSAGVTILTWLGLGFLVVGIAQGFGELIGALSHATTRAWNAPDSPRTRAEVDAAGDEYAYAVALLFKLILMAIVARLTMGQGKASAEETLALLRKSKLGEGFAEWVAKNQDALLRNPRLRPKPKAKQSEAPVQEAQSPSQVQKQAGKAEAAEEVAQPGMKQKKVKCFKKNEKGDPAEYDRQLSGQEKGLNDLTVKEYLDGRKRYSEIGREGTGAAQKEARDKYSKELQAQYEKQLGEDGIFGDEAAQKAAALTAERMKTLAALHNPDMIAGGKDVVTSMGDKGVNSSIGSQWKNGADELGRSRVEALDDAAKTVPENARGATKMNASLKRCK
ncbi:DUF6861 domain-containing protein [Roseateles saccharophilus]|uniref:Putative RNase toxin 15 of polymorphic toxin system n=1 Tax=Roseateles saccharophilus TaxID=304 RepID=A0A4R3UZJ9_ROSSA|nr:polymorphic toxin type 15 domain-containing protein [Roseateles saccharophilus]MDG0833094.1 hypothetical protein [Roseateles saccharophilus]TCU96293.1 putative RNase toxin 15 of polymorphic toxin system [Roseateles saccharophilus]